VHHKSRLALAATVLLTNACAAPVGDSPDPVVVEGDPSLPGQSAATGGAGQTDVFPGSGGAPLAETGGSAAASGGAANPGVGGSNIGTGGTNAGTGGGSNNLPVNCSGSGFTPVNGYVDNGTLCGFAWTATNGEGEVIDPPCGSSNCFVGSTLCTSGTIPAEVADVSYPGVMLGWSVAQSKEGGKETWTASGAGITVDFTTGGATGQARVMVQSGGIDYCAVAKSGTAIPWSQFAVGCWEGGPNSPAFTAGKEVDAIVVQLNSAPALQTFTDFCLTSVTNN